MNTTLTNNFECTLIFSINSLQKNRIFCNLVIEIHELHKNVFEELSKTKALYYSWLWIYYFVVVVLVERVVSLISNCSPNWSTQCSLSCLHSNCVIPPWKLATKASEEHIMLFQTASSGCWPTIKLKKRETDVTISLELFKNLSSSWKQFRI